MKLKHIMLLASLLLIIVALIIAIVVISSNEVEFTPPPFDSSAKDGFPVTDNQSFTSLSDEILEFEVHICGKLKVDGGRATVFFTNPESNSSNLKLRVLNESGDLICETGLIAPGQYIESIPLDISNIPGGRVMLKIMAYEKDTYHSKGSCTLRGYIE